MFDLSVIVPTHNRSAFLSGLLTSLASQDAPGEQWELIIVDDGSSDGTREYLENFGGPKPEHMRVLSQPQSGVALARNNGAHMAKGSALLFLDDDMIASPTLVGTHAGVHKLDSKAVVIGHISVPSTTADPWVAWENSHLIQHYQALRSGKRVPGPRDLYTGNCSVSSSLFESLGGFDTNLRRTEDVELGYRLRDAGANFYYRSEADSLHLGQHGFDGWLRNARLYGHMDVALAWNKGHVELQHEIARWFQTRPQSSRALVRICAAWPALQEPVISLLHAGGLATYKVGARRSSSLCYSAINNLAYWLGIHEASREFGDLGRSFL